MRKLEQLEAELEEKIESLKVVTQTSDALNMENKSEIDNQQELSQKVLLHISYLFSCQETLDSGDLVGSGFLF